MKENTIRKSVVFGGTGLHSAARVNLTLKPSESGGIVFRINDNEIAAKYDNVVDTQLGTTIGNGTQKILTIEHLMAALWACSIDNVVVEMDNQEVPILDGSSKLFIEEIRKAGIRELKTDKRYLKIRKEVVVEDKNKYIKASPNDKFSVKCAVEFDYGNIGIQKFLFNGKKDNFKKGIARARTFCNEKEIEYMRSVGLARGGSLDNAMVFNDVGLINGGGFRVEKEVVKHKILDCVGDMYTSGYNIIGKIISHKGGHTLNNMLLKKIFTDESLYEVIA
ncbi:MAG: UDP-3-O-acyl-N-acetylglucosamine deacetylase [Rickettsiales bacterium]|jgi:UDP-3-O-[3-hydroxymyristoyl] N-acetylglucosamine deacetylase|nr:UDP-3-O-acyl-N-acetylglucosamine deacetylase [Rickettsiales bacterium]